MAARRYGRRLRRGAAGTAVAVQTADRDVVVVPGAAIVITLAADVTVTK